MCITFFAININHKMSSFQDFQYGNDINCYEHTPDRIQNKFNSKCSIKKVILRFNNLNITYHLNHHGLF